MSWRTLLILLLVVAGLAWYAARTEDEAEAAREAADVVLFPGVDANLVTRVRVENVLRDLHLTFERGADGAWTISDPVVARAEPGTVDPVVEAALRARGPVLTAAEAADPAKLGLEPPRYVLDIESGTGDARVRRRVELGAPELDGLRLFARADGRILRISREIEPVISRELHEFRASAITTLDPSRVVEVRRRGRVPSAGVGPAPDLSFDALVADGAWRATAPVTGLCDPLAMAIYVRGVAGYRHEGEFDQGQRALSALGLDPPEITVTFGTTGTEVVEVLLGRTGGADRTGGWLGTVRGSGIAWQLPGEDAQFFALPLADLLDHRVVRARRSAVQVLELRAPDGVVRFERAGRGWTCASAPAGAEALGAAEPAEPGVVEDLLGALEAYELAEFVPGRAFEPGDAPLAFRVEGQDGQAAGTFGARTTDAQGLARVWFQRAGETAVALGDPAILESLAVDPEAALALLMLQADEARTGAIVVRGAGSERRYERDTGGRWLRAGEREEARELRPLLDALLFVRAARRLPAAEALPLERRIEVELVPLDASRGGTGGEPLRYALGLVPRDGAPRAEIDVGGRRGVARDADLHARLVALLGG